MPSLIEQLLGITSAPLPERPANFSWFEGLSPDVQNELMPGYRGARRRRAYGLGSFAGGNEPVNILDYLPSNEDVPALSPVAEDDLDALANLFAGVNETALQPEDVTVSPGLTELQQMLGAGSGGSMVDSIANAGLGTDDLGRALAQAASLPAPPRRLPPVDQPTEEALTENSAIRPGYGMSGDNALQLANDAIIARTGGGMSGGMSGGGGRSGGGGGYGGVPRPSDLDVLMGIGASLLAGGNLDDFIGTAGYVNSYQHELAQKQALLSQRLDRGRSGGAADTAKKNQQAIYTARMSGDIDKFIKARGQDVNGSIPPEEWENAWQQLRSKYVPLGLDPGPSPYELQWQEERNASPEFRRAEMVKKTREEHGDLTGIMLEDHLANGGDVVSFRRMLTEEQRYKRATEEARDDAREDRAKEIRKSLEDQVEEQRKRDLHEYENSGIIGDQRVQGYSSGDSHFKPDYMRGVDAINTYHDSLRDQVRRGATSLPGRLLGGGAMPVEDETQFKALTNQLLNRVYPQGRARAAGPASAVFGGQEVALPEVGRVVMFAPGTDTPLFSTPEERDAAASRALNVDDPAVASKALETARTTNRAILVSRNGQLFILQPPVE